MPKPKFKEIMNKDKLQPEINWQSRSLEVLETLSNVEITKEARVRPDGSNVTFTILKEHSIEPYFWSLLVDNRFFEKGIVTEPNNLLIDQDETAKSWGLKDGQTPGKKPEDWLLETDDQLTPSLETLAFPGTNSLWQKGGFFIKSENLLKLPDDETLEGNFETLVLTENGWREKLITFKNNQIETDLQGIFIGLSMPSVLKNGVPISQNEIVKMGHGRALGDLRNFIDFSDIAYKDPDFDFRFFNLIRKFQPATPSGARRIIEGDIAVVRSFVSKSEAETFKNIVEDKRWKLDKHFNVKEIGDENTPTRVVVQGPFPPNQIPITLIGYDDEGKLVAGFFDGRQKTSTGVTIDEAANIMIEKGAKDAFIGVAGGDVALVQKIQGIYKNNPEFNILNSPANRGHQTRLAPNMLAFRTPDPASAYLY